MLLMIPQTVRPTLAVVRLTTRPVSRRMDTKHTSTYSISALVGLGAREWATMRAKVLYTSPKALPASTQKLGTR